MDLRRRVLAMTVVGAGAVSVWGSFYITPYYGKVSRMKNKSLFQNSDCHEICSGNIDKCIDLNSKK